MNPDETADFVQIGRRILRLATVDSTNSVAATYANDPGNHGLVVTADSQTAGRGQYGRVWQCPPARGILMSILLFPPAELRRPAVFTAWAAVAVCETIEVFIGLEARIKWPNDVLIRDRKVCGILCEAGTRYVVAGIGLNVNQTAADFARMALPRATSLLLETGSPLDLNRLTKLLLKHLDAGYERLAGGEFATLEIDWKRRLGLVGSPVVAECMDGTSIHGRLMDMDFARIVLEQGNESVRLLPPEAIRHLASATQVE